ncbi:hypothetical protein [Pseudomonas sp. dw_358]|uniref:hypothetical protein n=1 Tax=Pseudomonas sp. dw_358 TaxID=2720083 RepID=UPI001BD5C9B4|nr:hypothetical protein [Pseudomonas sp. dw_358]
MATLEQALDSLDPPIKHELHHQGSRVLLCLSDPGVPASVERDLSEAELNNRAQFQMIVLYAVNELRAKGSHVELKVIPGWQS